MQLKVLPGRPAENTARMLDCVDRARTDGVEIDRLTVRFDLARIERSEIETELYAAGLDVEAVDGEPVTGATEPALHLVGDEQDAVLAAALDDARGQIDGLPEADRPR